MIISNATPLIAFARIAQLHLLNEIVRELVIPPAVYRELEEFPSNQPGVINLEQESWIQTKALESERQVGLLLPSLDRGEAEVIALALEHQPQLVLIDELTGRNVARSLNINVSGSVGILIEAKQQNKIAAVRPLLEQMLQQGIYFSSAFVRAVLEQVGEG